MLSRRRTFRHARQLAAAGRLSDAEALYNRHLATVPGDAVALHDLAVLAWCQGRKVEAVDRVRAAIVADGAFPEFFDSMATLLRDPDVILAIQGPWQGPFNGQRMRRSIFLELVERTRPARIFETGTLRGVTTRFMAESAPAAHVFSCEISVNHLEYARAQLARHPNVTLVHLDSRRFLEAYLPPFAASDAVSFFYLDAHWNSEDLPLLEELKLVLTHVRHPLIMIDDFQVPDDPGYAWDDYGPGRSLTLDYLRRLERPLHAFFPINSMLESGARRGSILLTVSEPLRDALRPVPLLRPVSGL